jgi:hypothetical protein
MEARKPNCPFCTSLIRLCSGLDFLPSDVEVRRLLAERLHRVAKNHDHAKAMIDHWLDTQTEAPKVADIVRLAGEVQSGVERLPPGCEICCGQPFVVTDQGARRCTCKRGQALRAMELAGRADRAGD